MAEVMYSNDDRFRSIVEHFKSLNMNGHPRFYELLAVMACTHTDKNSDYSDKMQALSNLRSSELIGIPPYIGTYIRMSDKVARMQNWMKHKVKEWMVASVRGDLVAPSSGLKVVDESPIDTLIDTSVYSLLEIILIEEIPVDQDVKLA